MLQEDSKPILDDDGGILQPAVDTLKDIAKQPGQYSRDVRDSKANKSDLPIAWNTWSMTYCTHLGPCGPNCPCSKRESACERTCHVSQLFIMKSRKLTYVSVMLAAQDAGEDVNVVRTPRT